MLPIILYIFIGIIGLYIALERPDITYTGNRSVPKEDVVHYGKITLRDLRMDKYTKYEGSSLFLKYYIVKKIIFRKENLITNCQSIATIITIIIVIIMI